MKLKNCMVFVLFLTSIISYKTWATEDSLEMGGDSSVEIDRGGGGGHGGGAHGGGGHGGPGYHGPGHGGPGWHGPGHGGPGYHGPGHVHEPIPIHGGYRHWPRWGHPWFARPGYNFDWGRVHLVTCTAEDSYGEQYPVTQEEYGYNFRDGIAEIEDQALDRCYYESNGDQSCQLVSCIPGY